jgi:outer membrane lipoprotein-sorting protein
MFKKQILVIFLLFSIFLISGCKNNQKKVNEFPEIVNNLDSYKITGKLYSMFPTGTKESLITVYFQKPEMYRVEIDNGTSGDKQIILKNNNDVFVLLPSVNKSFKLRSGWPINSSYPYLLQSLSKDYVNDDNKIITKEEKTTTIEMKMKMFDNASASTEKVIFSNETGYPQEVQVFDDNKNLVSRFVYMNIDENPKLDQTLFLKNETMTASFETYSSIEYQREKTYPTYYPINTKLEDEKTTVNNNERTYIMTYKGDVNYTIIEQEVIKTEKERTTYLDGDIYILGDAVAVINKSTVTFFQSGMEYLVASNEVNTLELLKMAYSLIVYQEK